MKKILIPLLVSLLLFGCSKKSDELIANTPSPSAQSEETSTPEPIKTPVPLDHQSFDSIYVIINKVYPLSEEYEPSDLVTPSVLATKDGFKLREEASNALEEMFQAAKDEGITLRLGSAYRSYADQKRIFNNYVSRDGEEAANRYSARPGESEHQTGLSVDISDASMNNWLKNSFKNTDEGIWLKNNSYKYGFILRFPEGKEEITGYIFEPWHFRYIGLEEAEKVYNSGLSMEEFYNFTK